MLTNLDFLEEGQPWPPKSESARIALYAENKALRENDVKQVWPDLNKYLRDDNKDKELKFWLGYPWLCTKKTGDLVLGKRPQILLPKTKTGTFQQENAGQAGLNDFLTALGHRSLMMGLLHDVDALGDAVQKISRDESGNVRIASVNPGNWFPIVIDGTNDILYHVLAFERIRKVEKEDKKFLEVEIHSKTTIEHRVYELTSSIINGLSATIGKRADWKAWYPGVKEIEANEAGDFLVVTSHNLKPSDSCFGRSSYTPDFKEVLKALIIRYVVPNNTLDVFGKPTVFGPRDYTEPDAVTGQMIFKPGRYIGITPDPHTPPIFPEALVWDAHITEARQEREDLKGELFNISEMSPVLFSQNALAGTAESGTALRLRLTNTLAKCDRIKEALADPIIKALQVAGKLAGMALEGLFIEWQENLPRIPLEEAQYYALMMPVLGRKECLRQMGYDQDEIAQIWADSSEEIL